MAIPRPTQSQNNNSASVKSFTSIPRPRDVSETQKITAQATKIRDLNRDSQEQIAKDAKFNFKRDIGGVIKNLPSAALKVATAPFKYPVDTARAVVTGAADIGPAVVNLGSTIVGSKKRLPYLSNALSESIPEGEKRDVIGAISEGTKQAASYQIGQGVVGKLGVSNPIAKEVLGDVVGGQIISDAESLKERGAQAIFDAAFGLVTSGAGPLARKVVGGKTVTPKLKESLTHEQYAKSQGYEPIVPTEQLPVIKIGKAPKGEPVVKLGSKPNVISPDVNTGILNNVNSPKGVPKTIETPFDVPKTTTNNTFYHGTKSPITDISQSDVWQYGDEGALFGQGTYLTDSADIAGSYAKNKGVGQSGKILEANLKPDIRLFNLENKLDSNSSDIFNGLLKNIHEGYGLSGNLDNVNGLTGKEAFRLLKDYLAGAEIPKYEAGDWIDSLQIALKEQGYEGFSHIGGIKGGTKHNVSIIFPDEKGLFNKNVLNNNIIKNGNIKPNTSVETATPKFKEQVIKEVDSLDEVPGMTKSDRITQHAQAKFYENQGNEEHILKVAKGLVKDESLVDTYAFKYLEKKYADDIAFGKEGAIDKLIDLTNSTRISASGQSLAFSGAEMGASGPASLISKVKVLKENAVLKDSGVNIADEIIKAEKRLMDNVSKGMPLLDAVDDFINSITCL